MSTTDLLEQIEALPPAKRARAEAYVEFLAHEGATETADDDPLVAKILARRESLRATIGTLDNHKDIRDMRENGSL